MPNARINSSQDNAGYNRREEPPYRTKKATGLWYIFWIFSRARLNLLSSRKSFLRIPDKATELISGILHYRFYMVDQR